MRSAVWESTAAANSNCTRLAANSNGRFFINRLPHIPALMLRECEGPRFRLSLQTYNAGPSKLPAARNGIA
jgi:hypothetical protein